MSLICATYLSLMCQTHISFYCLDSLKTSPWQFPELLAKRVSGIKLLGLSINIRLNLSVYRKMTRIWVSRFGGVRGCSIFSGTCLGTRSRDHFLKASPWQFPALVEKRVSGSELVGLSINCWTQTPWIGIFGQRLLVLSPMQGLILVSCATGWRDP